MSRLCLKSTRSIEQGQNSPCSTTATQIRNLVTSIPHLWSHPGEEGLESLLLLPLEGRGFHGRRDFHPSVLVRLHPRRRISLIPEAQLHPPFFLAFTKEIFEQRIKGPLVLFVSAFASALELFVAKFSRMEEERNATARITRGGESKGG